MIGPFLNDLLYPKKIQYMDFVRFLTVFIPSISLLFSVCMIFR